MSQGRAVSHAKTRKAASLLRIMPHVQPSSMRAPRAHGAPCLRTRLPAPAAQASPAFASEQASSDLRAGCAHTSPASRLDSNSASWRARTCACARRLRRRRGLCRFTALPALHADFLRPSACATAASRLGCGCAGCAMRTRVDLARLRHAAASRPGTLLPSARIAAAAWPLRLGVCAARSFCRMSHAAKR